jgi:hypothetical protein
MVTAPASHALVREFYRLRHAAYGQRALRAFWRDMALRCAKEVAACDATAAKLLDAAMRKGAEAIVECSREESRAHAHRLADVLAWMEGPVADAEFAAVERATLDNLDAERAGL